MWLIRPITAAGPRWTCTTLPFSSRWRGNLQSCDYSLVVLILPRRFLLSIPHSEISGSAAWFRVNYRPVRVVRPSERSLGGVT